MPTPEAIKALLDKFEETLAKWPRDGGLFIELMGQKLKKIEQDLIDEIASGMPKTAFDGKKNANTLESHGEKEVYVALYQTIGDNIERWELTLKALASQGVSRPIYQTENDVCGMIRSKENKNKEAYAVVKVLTSDITTPPVTHQDKAGRVLLHVKPHALKPANIMRFVHISGQYLWQKDHLVKLDLPSPILTSEK